MGKKTEDEPRDMSGFYLHFIWYSIWYDPFSYSIWNMDVLLDDFPNVAKSKNNTNPPSHAISTLVPQFVTAKLVEILNCSFIGITPT